MRRAEVSAVRPFAEEATLFALAGSVLLFAPAPTVRAQASALAAVALGASAGLALFAVLARRLRPPRLNRRLAAALPFLLLRAGAEEALWRRGVLVLLAPWVGIGGAVAVSSTGFAISHGTGQSRRQLAARAGVGCAFAGLFLATGRLLAAVAAHAVYNTLVLAALVAAEPERR